MTDRVVNSHAMPRGTNERALTESVKAATHLTREDRGLIRAVRGIAKRLDTLEALGEDGLGDRVTYGTYIKGLELLGLTPAARRKAVAPVVPVAVGSEASGGGDKRARISALRTTGRPSGSRPA